MSALKQPSAASNCGCFDWTSSAHISLGSGMPKHAKIVPITAGRRTLHELHNEMMVPIRNGTCVQLSFSELLMRYFQGRKSLHWCLAWLRNRWFDSIPKVSELPDHLPGAQLLLSFAEARAAFFVTCSLMQDQ